MKKATVAVMVFMVVTLLFTGTVLAESEGLTGQPLIEKQKKAIELLSKAKVLQGNTLDLVKEVLKASMKASQEATKKETPDPPETEESCKKKGGYYDHSYQTCFIPSAEAPIVPGIFVNNTQGVVTLKLDQYGREVRRVTLKPGEVFEEKLPAGIYCKTGDNKGKQILFKERCFNVGAPPEKETLLPIMITSDGKKYEYNWLVEVN